MNPLKGLFNRLCLIEHWQGHVQVQLSRNGRETCTWNSRSRLLRQRFPLARAHRSERYPYSCGRAPVEGVSGMVTDPFNWTWGSPRWKIVFDGGLDEAWCTYGRITIEFFGGLLSAMHPVMPALPAPLFLVGDVSQKGKLRLCRLPKPILRITSPVP